MSTLTAVKSILMGIAAQGAVTVTIPSDSEIARELGPIEMTRKVGPVELTIRTAPEKNAKQAAPEKTLELTGPEKTQDQATPVQETNSVAPQEATNQPAAEKAIDKPAPKKVTGKFVPEKPAKLAAPKEPAKQVALETLTRQAAPSKTPERTAPARLASQTPLPAPSIQDVPEQQTGYAGLWYDHSGRSAIKISNCGDSLCGRIVWLKDSTHNSVCGTPIIGDVEKVGNVYDRGWIYDIDRGKKFDVELKLLNESKLRVKGYAGTKLLSKTFVWKRAPGDLKLCA